VSPCSRRSCGAADLPFPQVRRTVLVEVRGTADLATVDALARLQLAAERRGAFLCVH